MRSSKKRSRSSQNRPRTLGNIINRVFDSSGPEGKVRGTPQQIIEKYQMLARDAQLSNDRVAAENFLQHAEHYTRMLAEATREMAAEQEARQQQYQQNGGQNGQSNGQSNGGQNGQSNGNQNGQPQSAQGYAQNGQPQRNDRQGEGRDRQGERQGERNDRNDRFERADRPERTERRPEFQRDFREERDPGVSDQPRVVDVIDLDAGDETGLIETPESGSRRRPEPVTVEESPVAAEASDAKEERTVNRRPRGPRKPKAEAKPDGEPPKEAAE